MWSYLLVIYGYLICTVLHVKKCTKAVSYFKVTNGQKSKQETTFNRFVLLGVVGRDKVVAVFTNNQVEKVELLRFCNHLQPGSACGMIRPIKFDHKYMGSNKPYIEYSGTTSALKIENIPLCLMPKKCILTRLYTFQPGFQNVEVE